MKRKIKTEQEIKEKLKELKEANNFTSWEYTITHKHEGWIKALEWVLNKRK